MASRKNFGQTINKNLATQDAENKAHQADDVLPTTRSEDSTSKLHIWRYDSVALDSKHTLFTQGALLKQTQNGVGRDSGGDPSPTTLPTPRVGGWVFCSQL